MTIDNNINAVNAAFEAYGSVANAIAGFQDNTEYSVAAQNMGAGRYDALTISEEYYQALENGYAPDWQTSGQYDTASVLMGNSGNTLSFGNISPETMTASTMIEAYQKVNETMIETQLQMLEDTIAMGVNKHNAADYFE
jgi:hypothetical protein